MLEKIHLKNFRGFESFELKDLGQLNLLVGNNNCGKTSVLEGIQMLCARTDLDTFFEALGRRGEFFISDDNDQEREFDIRHLFNGHDIDQTNQFSISGTHENGEEKLEISINQKPHSSSTIRDFIIARITESSLAKQDKLPTESLKELFEQINESELENIFDEEQIKASKLSLEIDWSDTRTSEMQGVRLSLSNQGCLSPEKLAHYRNRKTKPAGTLVKTNFVTSSSLTSKKMVELFDEVVLTPEEIIIHEALQTIEPKISRIATLGTERYRRTESRTGFMALLSDSPQRVPIGSFGDGIWRMLGLALATTSTANGVLFIDEIDTGLHFSAMSKMWKLVWETAQRLNVQIFATTHNSDCWTSLASLVEENQSLQKNIAIHRIEKGRSSSVVFNAKEMAIAAERGIEVR